MAKIKFEDKKVITPKFRVSYPHLDKPHAFKKDQEPKYSVQMLFDKDADLKGMRKAAHMALVEKWGEDKSDWPTDLAMPFNDGNKKKGSPKEYKNKIFVSASSKEQPQIVDNKRQPIIEKGAFYAGCYARASLVAFAYDVGSNQGVSFALLNLQKVGDGEKFSGRKDAAEEFDEIEDDSDDEANYSDEPSEDEESDLGF